MQSRLTACLALAVLGSGLTWVAPAGAALGQAEATVESDQRALSGTRRVEAMGRSAVHEIRTSSGTAVREFAAGGRVFAVAWDGPFLPDLRQILGDYAGLVVASRAQRRGHGPLIVRTPDLVVESRGHMRHFHGRAYLPARVPEDIAVDALH